MWRSYQHPAPGAKRTYLGRSGAGACARLPSLGQADHVVESARCTFMKKLWVRGDGVPKGIYGPAGIECWRLGDSRKGSVGIASIDERAWVVKLGRQTCARRCAVKSSNSFAACRGLNRRQEEHFHERAKSHLTFRRRPPPSVPCPNIRQDSRLTSAARACGSKFRTSHHLMWPGVESLGGTERPAKARARVIRCPPPPLFGRPEDVEDHSKLCRAEEAQAPLTRDGTFGTSRIA